jgi:hypothetical protein
MPRRKRSVLEDLEFYERVSGSGRFTGPIHMFSPSLRSRRTAGPASGSPSQEQSSGSSPAAAAGEQEDQQSGKG